MAIEGGEHEARVLGSYGTPLNLRRRSWIDVD
jgi:hypothetical protein